MEPGEGQEGCVHVSCQLGNIWLGGIGYPRRRRDTSEVGQMATEKGSRVVPYSTGGSRRREVWVQWLCVGGDGEVGGLLLRQDEG